MRADSVIALRAGEDASAVLPRLAHAREQFMSTRSIAPCVRPVVADSWQRCAMTGASPDDRCLPALRMRVDALEVYRSGHPLAVVLPVFRDLLGERADDGEYIFAVTDSAGTLLWVQGHVGTLRRAERMNFVEGAAWSESAAGTNAPGTALTVGRPVQIFAAEHYRSVVQPWSCSAAPIRDPASGQILGTIDITGGDSIASPNALALVGATARAAEAELALRAATNATARRVRGHRGEPGPPATALAIPGGLVAAGAPGRRRNGFPAAAPVTGGAVRLTALGRDCALLEVDGRVLRLRPRHSEIVVLLALAMNGLSGPRLAVGLSEEEIHPVTLRAEMSRLRGLLGEALLGSQPYELRRPVRADFTAVRGLLAEGRVAAALAAYSGPLLPDSEAPAIVAQRDLLGQQLRAEVLASADAAVLRRWVDAAWGADDVEAWLALARVLPGGSPQRAAAAARASALDRELGASRLTPLA